MSNNEFFYGVIAGAVTTGVAIILALVVGRFVFGPLCAGG
jgi:hypothetical protein